MCPVLNCSQQSRSATLHEKGLQGPYLNFDIEDSSISIYEFELLYRRFFDIGYFDIEVQAFNIRRSMFLHF
jgi:hypothetical protein